MGEVAAKASEFATYPLILQSGWKKARVSSSSLLLSTSSEIKKKQKKRVLLFSSEHQISALNYEFPKYAYVIMAFN